jgi:UDP-N-acetylglucosamine/UDP-N-acetylgalactosamine 4-epimerase
MIPKDDWLDPALREQLGSVRRSWLVTGGAGFIGSHLVSCLLRHGQTVRILDDFSTGHRANLHQVEAEVGADAWRSCEVRHADIRDRQAVEGAVGGVEVVLHQAALGSVPRSIADPLLVHDVNATGFLNVLDAARRAHVGSFVYAASSAAYGSAAELPKVEERTGAPLSPYALSKQQNEQHADLYARVFGYSSIGLRYFNVFGPRQDPQGSYAAVIPRWIAAMIHGDAVVINGDGETSRDFSYIANIVQANIRAALAPAESRDQIYNVAVQEQATLKTLFAMLQEGLARRGCVYAQDPVHQAERRGDVRHSLGSIEKARLMLGYGPSHTLRQGLEETLDWYLQSGSVRSAARSA